MNAYNLRIKGLETMEMVKRLVARGWREGEGMNRLRGFLGSENTLDDIIMVDIRHYDTFVQTHNTKSEP